LSAGYYLAGYANPATQTTLVGARTFEVEDATTDAASTIVTLRHITTGTPAAGIGSRLLYQAEDSAGNNQNAAAWDGVLSTVTDGSEVGALVGYVTSGGSLAERVRFGGASVIVNDTGADVDFVIESHTNANLFTLDAGNNNIGLGGAPTSGNLIHIVQPVSTSGSPSAFVITGGAHTTLAASTEAPDVAYDIARTVEFATGGLTTQRAVIIEAPTYAFAGASTLTNPITLDIQSAPGREANAETRTLTYS
jgi:hypothetical protein